MSPPARPHQPQPAASQGPVYLNWKHPKHSASTEKPCRYCGKPTYLRDSKRSPAHKVCAEQSLAQQAVDAVDAYEREHLG